MKKNSKNKFLTYLNNGDIKSTFDNNKNYIEAIKTSNYLEYDVIGELLSVPGVIDEKGMFVFILEKRSKIIKKTLEKDTFINRYYINCLNSENYYMVNEDRSYIVLLKEGKYYFPIYKLKKDGKKDKKIILTKKYDNDFDKNMIQELKNYYNKSCVNNIISKIEKTNLYSNKNIINLLKDSKFKIKTQILDKRNKVRFLKMEDGHLLPVKPSGSSYDYPSELYIDKLVTQKLKDVLDFLKQIEKVLKMNYVPKLVYYTNEEKNGYLVTSLSLQNGFTFPVSKDIMKGSSISKLGLSYAQRTRESFIDEKIAKDETIFDEINNQVKIQKYNQESYNLFRLELSLYLEENNDVKEKIIGIVRNKNLKKEQKKMS